MREIKILKNVVYYECKKHEIIMKQKTSLNLKVLQDFLYQDALKNVIYYECKTDEIIMKKKIMIQFKLLQDCFVSLIY